MDYLALAMSGPIGSGAVESACRQQQCRFKRAGQFWSEAGLLNLCAFQEPRPHHDEQMRPRRCGKGRADAYEEKWVGVTFWPCTFEQCV